MEKLTHRGKSPQGVKKKGNKVQQHPGFGQGKIDKYFHKISRINNTKGVRNGSLLSASGYSDVLIPSSEGTGLITVESGGREEQDGKNRTCKVLEKWPHLLARMESSGGRGSGQGKGVGKRKIFVVYFYICYRIKFYFQRAGGPFK